MYENSSSYTFSLFSIIILFNISHLKKWVVVFHLVLMCISLIINNVGHLFKCLIAICIFSLIKCQFTFLPIVLSYFFTIEFKRVLYVFWIQALHQMYVLHINSPKRWLYFHNSIFQRVVLNYLFLKKKKNFTNSKVTKVLLCCLLQV